MVNMPGPAGNWLWHQWDGNTWVPCPGVEMVMEFNGHRMTVPKF